MFFLISQFIPPSIPLWVFGWIFSVIGIISLAVLVIYTKYGREISIKLSLIAISIAALFLSFGLHFILLNLGV